MERRATRRQAEQQREWEERFRQWSEYQNSQRGNSGYGGYWNMVEIQDITMVKAM